MEARINGAEIHFEVDGTGLPVVFIHGFPLSGEMWGPAAALLGDEYKLITPDLRGLGRSEATERFEWRQYADDVRGVLDQIQEDRPAVFVGHSMGGYVAFDFFRHYHRRVRGLVLVDTRAEADSPEARKNRLELADKVTAKGSAVAADAFIGKLFGPGATEEFKREWYDLMAGSSPMGVAEALRAMAERPDSTPLLERIDVPTLIVVGEHDAITPPETARKMHQAIRGSALTVIPGAGHTPPLEKPEAFAAALRDFLERVRSE